MAELSYAVMLMFEMQTNHLFCFREDTRAALLAHLREQFSDVEIKEAWGKYSVSEFMKNYHCELPFEDIYIGEDEQLMETNDIKLTQITLSIGHHVYHLPTDATLTCNRDQIGDLGVSALKRGADFALT
jgi:hypothetical protein